MDVLMLAPQPYFEPRGTPISVNQRLAALSKLGHKVDLVTFHIGEDTPMVGLTIHRVPKVPFIRTVRIGPSGAKLLLDLLLFVKAFFMLMRKRYDVIHSHEEAAYMALLLAPLFNCLHFYDMHSSLPRQLENFQFADARLIVHLFEAIERMVLRSADAVITIGKDLDEYVLSIYAQAPIHRIENRPMLAEAGDGRLDDIMELGRFLKDNDSQIVVYTGSFERYQGLESLVLSIKELEVSYPALSVLLVGGDEQQVVRMRQFVDDLGLSKNVQLVGQVPIAQAFVYLEIADILVSPRIEGTSIPLKIYSYLSAGKAILASRIAAHTQVLDETMAVLVEPNTAGLAAGLKRLLDDEALRLALGRKSADLARRRYSSSNYLGKIEMLYRGGQTEPAVLPGARRSADK